MRTIGKRQTRPVHEHASGKLLEQGAIFNDQIHQLPTGKTTYFPKGVYRYKTHEEANTSWDTYLVEGIARNARK